MGWGKWQKLALVWRKLRSEEDNDLYSSLNTTRVVKLLKIFNLQPLYESGIIRVLCPEVCRGTICVFRGRCACPDGCSFRRLSSGSLCLSSCCNSVISPRELRGVVACRLIIQVRNGRNEAVSCEHYTAREPCNEAQEARKAGIAFDTTSRKSRTCVRYWITVRCKPSCGDPNARCTEA